MGGNVTRAPRSFAVPVDDPAIQEVRNLRTGRLYPVNRLLRKLRYDHAVPVRAALREAATTGRLRLSCAICNGTVHLACSPIKRWYFRHRHEDGSCPAITRNDLSEADIRAVKYRGAQESDKHRHVKALLMQSLAADPRFADTVEEKSWHASEGRKGLRRPDVSSRLDALRIAFEVQLSTTFLDVVIGRRDFYRGERAALVWVLPRFHPLDRRMTDDDILFGNNSNILVVDEGSLQASRQAERLILRCWYRKPRLQGEEIVDDWVERLVAWDDLHIDTDRQTVAAFDFNAAEAALIEERRLLRERQALAEAARIAEQAARAAEQAARLVALEKAAEDRLRDELFDLALSNEMSPIERYRDWERLNYQLVAYGAHLMGSRPSLSIPQRMVYLIESARSGRPVGFKFKHLIQIGHYLFDQHPGLLVGFGRMLRAFGTKPLFDSQDRTGRWVQKITPVRRLLMRDQLYQLPSDEERLFAFLSRDASRAQRR